MWLATSKMDLPFLEALAEEEARFKRFSMAGTNDVLVAGNIKAGFTVNIQKEGGEGAGGGTPVTGACCLPDGTCEVVTFGQCLLDGGIFQGAGTPCDPNPCAAPDCTSCDDLPPTNPSGPPTHINVVCELSGSCGDVNYSGTMTYDEDLSFTFQGPVGGHFFCAHNILDTGEGGIWTGEFTQTCTLDETSSTFANAGTTGLLGRDTSDCSWWIEIDVFELGGGGPVGICDGCFITFGSSIFEMVGDPPNTYTFTRTDTGVTLTITVTVT
jgi:hypothetical protein